MHLYGLSTVFNVQRKFPSKKKDDWVSEIKGDLKKCNINFSDEEIKTMSKYTFKRIIREAIDLKVMSYLIELQGKHSKSKNLVYSSETQTYLRSNKLSTENKKILFKLRSKMFPINETLLKTRFKWKVSHLKLFCSYLKHIP